MRSCARRWIMSENHGGKRLLQQVEREVRPSKERPLIQAEAQSRLRKSGYRVLVAGEAREALAVAGEGAERIDLLVTDVVMPGLSGPALAEQLLVRHPGLRVLFVSGYTQDAIGCDGVLQADVEFLQKPFRMGALLARVRSVLESSGARRR